MITLGHGGGKIKRKSIMAVLFLCAIALPLSASTAFASTNVTNVSTNQSNASILVNNTTQSNTIMNVTNSSSNNNSTTKNTSSTVTSNNSTTKNTSSTVTSNNTTQFSNSQIEEASTHVQSFVDTNGRLPNYVTIANQQVTMPEYLKLLSQTLLDVNNGSNAALKVSTVSDSTNSVDSVSNGNIYKSEYLTIAQNVLNFINNNGRIPNYASSSLGQISSQNLIYTFSKILNFQYTNNRLPNYVSMTSWTKVSSAPTSAAGSAASTSVSTSSIQAILDTIGYKEATFADVQGVTYNGKDDASVITHYGYGDCWADASWLYDQLNAAGIQARIVGYSGVPSSSVWYAHAWTQINIGNGWVDWNYAKYGSQHHGNGGGYTVITLINPSNSTAEIASTGY